MKVKELKQLLGELCINEIQELNVKGFILITDKDDDCFRMELNLNQDYNSLRRDMLLPKENIK